MDAKIKAGIWVSMAIRLSDMAGRAAAEAKAVAEATKPPAEPKKPGFLGRLLEKAQKPL